MHDGRLLVNKAACSRVMVLLLLVLVVCGLCNVMVAGTTSPATTPVVTIKPTVGPPTTSVLVSGSGFDPNARVDIYFDTTDLATTTTNSSGSFGGGNVQSGIAIQVPVSAVPGSHWIWAFERSGQKLAQKSFLVRTNWAQFHFDPSQEGLNPYENVLSQETVGGLTLRWSYQAYMEYVGSPAVADGVAFVGYYGGDLYALDAQTGNLLWQYPVDIKQSTPAVADGVVYTLGGGSLQNGGLYAFDSSTGTLLWRAQTGYQGGDLPRGITVANGAVYFASNDGNVYAVNTADGSLRWSYPIGNYSWYSPAVVNGIVYIGSIGSGSLYALNAETGTLVWTYACGVYGFGVSSGAAVANNVVYFGCGETLYALNAQTGALIWQYPLSPGYVTSSPAVANGLVYFGSYDELLYALDANTGALLWTFATGGEIDSSPAIANGIVYFGSMDSNLYAVNAESGTLLWEY